MNNLRTALSALIVVGLSATAACTQIEAEPEVDDDASELIEGECDIEGEKSACGADDEGVQTCVTDDDGLLVWSACVVSQCAAGETQACSSAMGQGVQSCVIAEDGTGSWGVCDVSGSVASTPLVLVFPGTNEVSFTSAPGGFALHTEMSVATDWVSSATPWLALDRDQNGRIDGGHELFGSATVLASGLPAPHGFSALAELDENRDGLVSAADPAFASLSAWIDADQDRETDAGELVSLTTLGIESLSTSFEITERCDDRGNCERESGSMSLRTASGAATQGKVIDVHLAHR